MIIRFTLRSWLSGSLAGLMLVLSVQLNVYGMLQKPATVWVTFADGTTEQWSADAAVPSKSHGFSSHVGRIICAAYSPDGKSIVTGATDGTAKIWDINTGSLRFTLVGHLSNVLGVVYAPDGKTILTFSQDHTARVWDASTGMLLHTLRGHTNWVDEGIFSPDGKTILTGSADTTAKLWDASTGQLLHTLPIGQFVQSIGYLPDGKAVVIGTDDPTVSLWDSNTGKLLKTLKGHTKAVPLTFFAFDGKTILTASRDHTIKIWDAKTGVLLHTLVGTSDIRSAAYAPNGKQIAVGTESGTVEIWAPSTGERLSTLAQHTKAVIRVAYAPDGNKLITASADHTAGVWDVRTGALLYTLRRNPADAIWLVAFSSDSKTVMTGMTDDVVQGIIKDDIGVVRVWDTASGTLLQSVPDPKLHATGLRTVAYAPDGKTVLTGAGDHTAKLWALDSGSLLQTFQVSVVQKLDSEFIVDGVAYAPDGKTILTGSGNNVKIWDIRTGSLLRRIEVGTVLSIAYAPDSKTVLVGGVKGQITTWDITTGQNQLTLQGLTDSTWSVAYAPDGKTFLTGGTNGARLWDAGTGKRLFTLQKDFVNTVAYSPDSKTILTGDAYHTAKIWSVTSGRLLYTLVGHKDEVTAVAYSSDGNMILTGSKDHTVKVWDAHTGVLLNTVQRYTDSGANRVDPVVGVSFGLK